MSLKFVDVMDPGTYYISNTYYIGKNSIKSKKREKSERRLKILSVRTRQQCWKLSETEKEK